MVQELPILDHHASHITNHAKQEPLEPMTNLTFMVIGWESEHQLWRTTTLRSNQGCCI
ncbi:hypothetical protein Bca4012_037715 [Brassica carinata]